MNKLYICVILTLCFVFCACNLNSYDSSIIGTWTEYRADGDNYGLASWKFNSDGSGLFSVQGYTNRQQVAFTWQSRGATLIEINMNGDYQTLEVNNGLLIENDYYMGAIVYKKQ
jgi:hypothetical protein